MKLPISFRLKYRLLTRSDEDKELSVVLDTNPINREFFPNGVLAEHEISAMIERFVRGYEEYKTPIFMIFDSENNFIGRAGFAYTIELNVIEMGYVIDHKYWGKGYATEIAKTLLDWAKGNLEDEEIFAFTGIKHLASIAIMKKIGMKYVDNRVLKGIECVLYKIGSN